MCFTPFKEQIPKKVSSFLFEEQFVYPFTWCPAFTALFEH